MYDIKINFNKHFKNIYHMLDICWMHHKRSHKNDKVQKLTEHKAT